MNIQRTEQGYKAAHWEATGLPPRASQVLVLRALGFTCAETAEELGCGTETIKNRIKDLHYKLKARNNAQLINNAIVAGNLKIERTKWLTDNHNHPNAYRLLWLFAKEIYEKHVSRIE